jgi:uncharacterized protein YjlB
MSQAVQRRRGTSAEHAGFTGLLAEITYNTTTKQLHVHDGTTVGGIPIVSGATNLSYTAATRLLASSTGTDVTLPLATGSDAGLMASADFTKLAGVEAGAQANVATDLSYTAATRTLLSSTGADVVLPVANGSDAGLMAAADFTKLGGIAAGAQVNVATDLGYTDATRVLTSSTGADVTLPLAGGTNPGLMASTDFTKLAGIAPGADVNVATDLGYTAATRALTSSTGADVTLPLADGSNPGLMASADFTKLGGIAAGAQVNVATDLSYTAATRVLASSTGADATLTLADGSNPGLMASADFTKLGGIAAGAQVNVATDLSYTAATRVLASSTGVDATLPLLSSGDAGLAPASGGGTTNFLRADGTWAAPPTQTVDLGYTAATRLLTSSAGADVTLPLLTSTEAGLAPLSGGGTTNFLRADGTWNAPPSHTRLHAMTDVSDHSAGNWKVFHSNGSGQVAELALGAAGQALISAGAAAAPAFVHPTPTLFKILSADENGQAINTVQPWFPTAGAVTLSTGLYMFEGMLLLTMGTTSCSVSVNFAGTATFTGAHTAIGSRLTEGGNGGTQQSEWSASLTAQRQVTAAATTAGAAVWIRGIIRVTVAGTLIPQFTFSVNPTGTNTVKANTFFALTKLDETSTTTVKGTWA